MQGFRLSPIHLPRIPGSDLQTPRTSSNCVQRRYVSLSQHWKLVGDADGIDGFPTCSTLRQTRLTSIGPTRLPLYAIPTFQPFSLWRRSSVEFTFQHTNTLLCLQILDIHGYDEYLWGCRLILTILVYSNGFQHSVRHGRQVLVGNSYGLSLIQSTVWQTYKN